MRIPLFLIAFIWTGLSFAQQSLDELLEQYNEESVPYVSAAQLADLQESDQPLILLDARETEEYNTSHLPGAILVGYDNFDLQKFQRLNISEDSQVVVYCTVGVRSEDIGEQLQQMGFKNVSNLKGGIVSWKNSGFPVYNQEEQPTQRVHVYGPSWSIWLTNGIPTYD